MTMIAIARAGECLDELVWRSTGHTADIVEATLATNPHLAERADALPEGYSVTIPDFPKTATTVDIIQLWD